MQYFSGSVMVRGKTRVIVGMSGGVDSSATAALLLEQGYDVIGITLKLWPQDCVSRAEDKCCGPQAVMDARAVCHKLGVPYYLIDEADAVPDESHSIFRRRIQSRPHAESVRHVQSEPEIWASDRSRATNSGPNI